MRDGALAARAAESPWLGSGSSPKKTSPQSCHCSNRCIAASLGSLAPVRGYFREIFFGNPWRISTCRVVADQHGDLAGFAGVLPRRMMSGTAAAGRGWLPVHGPSFARRSLIALQIVKTVLSAPRTVSSPMDRTSWRGACARDRGTVPILQNLDWTALATTRALLAHAARQEHSPPAIVARGARAMWHWRCTGMQGHPNRFDRTDTLCRTSRWTLARCSPTCPRVVGPANCPPLHLTRSSRGC